MKAIPLDAIVSNADTNMALLRSLVIVAEGLRGSTRESVLRGLFMELGEAENQKHYWEEKAQELDYPTGASP